MRVRSPFGKWIGIFEKDEDVTMRTPNTLTRKRHSKQRTACPVAGRLFFQHAYLVIMLLIDLVPILLRILIKGRLASGSTEVISLESA
jgi:hypothetical protein